MQTKHKQAISYYGLSFGLPLVLVLIGFAIMGLVPFGNHNLLFSDLGTQYMPFLAEFKRQVAHLNFSAYSFSLSLGGNLVPLAAYYLISPFNLLLLLGSNSQLPVMVSYVIALKICTMGVTMSYFLRTRTTTYHYAALIFSTAYSLCSFVAMNFYNLMWLDALILVPLIVIGLERLFSVKKPTFYIVTLTISILTNYYLGYMTCLFAVLYMISLVIKQRQPQQKWGHLLQQQARVIWQFIWSSLIVGGLSAIILLPALLGMLKTGKKTIAMTSFYPTPQFGWEVFTQFQVGGSRYTQRLTHEPTLFVGTLALLFAVLYFMLPQIRKQAKYANGFLVISLALSFWVTTFNTIWHMFQQPEGFPYRNAYLFSFVLIKIAYEASLVQGQNKKAKGWAIALVSGLLVIGQLRLHGNQSYPQVTAQSWVLLSSYTIFLGLLFYYWGQTNRHYQKILITGVVLVSFGELVTNFQLMTHKIPLGYQKQYAQQYQRQAALYEQLSEKDNDFYRVNNQSILLKSAYREPYYGYNDALLFGQYTLNNYSSTLDEQMRSMLVDLGFYSKNVRRINGVGHTAITDLLFANRYDLQPKNQQTVIQRHQTLGLGFAVNRQLAHVTLKKHRPFDNQDRLLQAMVNTDQAFYTNHRVNMVHEEIKAHSYRYTLEIPRDTQGPTYLYLPHQNLARIKLFVNGRKKKTPIRVTSAAIIPLEDSHKGQPLRLTVISPKRQNINHFQVATLNQERFNQAVKQLDQQKLTTTALWQDNGHVTGDIKTMASNQLLYLSIPYDAGWQAKVNGQTIKPKKVMANMLAVPLKRGANQVQLRYRAPGLLLGQLISLVTLLIWLIILIGSRWRKRV
ncbi:YfhO family protein [Latilactobacillus sakei]|uniref:YfhO family protein n=1 Tax=Latilactobacillus sakei TaxID=1599 RepID=UPI003F53E495